jgi:hypothetical protein
MFHPEVVHRVELIVIDNSPGGESGKSIETLVNRMKSFFRDAKYIAAPGRGGPAATKGRVFAEATGNAVLCMDCHILLAPGSLASLLEFYDTNPGCQDLLTGPLETDESPNLYWTHFDNVWSGQMLGTWGVAMCCNQCGKRFSVLKQGDEAEYRALDGDGSEVITNCGCGPLPAITWAQHEGGILKHAFGFSQAMERTEPFEVPAQGMGVFTCRRDAWLGFNPQFRGFGGEEFYIHEKYRKTGRKTVCMPFLKWLHRFARPNGTKYPVRVEDRVRNYILGHQELGLDLARCHEHFIATGVSEETWQAILADPVGYGQSTEHRGSGCNSCKKEIEPMDLEQVFRYYADKASDFNEHFSAIREFAAKCEHVTEFGARDYGVIALLAGQPKELRSYNSQPEGAAFWKAERIAKEMGVKLLITHEEPNMVEIDETDLLFCDTNGHDLLADLERHYAKLRRFVVVHDTEVYGAKLPDGRPGLKIQLMQFMRLHPEWTVVYSTVTQHGLMVLSRNPDDKPKRPSIIQMGPTFLKHLGQHVVDGLKNVGKEQLEARLEECWLCDLRTANEQCSLCGCPLLDKASWRSSRCDANKWDAIDTQFAETPPEKQ